MLNVLSCAKKIRETMKPYYDKLPITVYQLYAKHDRDRIMFVFMNPSNKKNDDFEDEKIEDAQKGFRNWLLENSGFYTQLFQVLGENIPGDYLFKNVDDWSYEHFHKYVESSFFDDFYVTDNVKLRLKTGEIRKIMALKDIDDGRLVDNRKEEKTRIQGAWANILKEEIRHVSPSIVLSFGAASWNSLKTIVEPKSGKSITRVHGIPFRLMGECDYLPLAFIPGTSSYLRNSYFDYLEEGLNKIR